MCYRKANIQLTNIKKTYSIGDGGFEALKGINLDIKKGEFLSIIGPSGSGKSTLMNIVGFLDDYDQGNYFFEGGTTSGLKDDELAFLRNRKFG